MKTTRKRRVKKTSALSWMVLIRRKQNSNLNWIFCCRWVGVSRYFYFKNNFILIQSIHSQSFCFEFQSEICAIILKEQIEKKLFDFECWSRLSFRMGNTRYFNNWFLLIQIFSMTKNRNRLDLKFDAKKKSMPLYLWESYS